MINMKHTPKQGFSLVEMLIYVALMALIAVALVNSIMTITRSYNQLRVRAAIDASAATAFNRMILEIRNAESIDVATSTFDTSPGALGLNSTDSSGNATTTRFYVASGRLRLIVGTADQGPLTASTTAITSLIFRRLSTTTSEAVKIEMQIDGQSGHATKTGTYYSTVVLRGSY